MIRALLALLALSLAGCSEGDARQEKKAAAPPALPVSALQLEVRAVPVTFEAVGRAEGSREVQVRARVSGIIERQLYSEGDAVKAGAPLFRIDRRPLEIEAAQARAALAQERARLEQAEKEAERLKGLTDRRAISQKEADQALFARKQAAAAVELARARLRQAELNLSYTTVNAPIGGITGRALQSVGTLVSPNNESALLTTITRNDPIWVRFAFSEAEYASLRSSGDKPIEVRIELADGSTYPHPGKLNFAGSTVDAATGTVQMRAELPNPQHKLLPGQYVRVRVLAGSQQAIVVPQTAVMQNETGRFVWIVGEGGKAQPRNIRAGGWVGADWVVLEGLKPGETLILDNLSRLRPGTSVQVNNQG